MTKENLFGVQDQALKFGMSVTDIADVLSRWGPAVLTLVVDGLRNGLNWQFLKELLEVLAPLMTAHAQADCCSQNFTLVGPKTFKAAPVIIQGEQTADASPFPFQGLIIDWLLQVLPNLLQTYGPQVITWLINLITAWLQQAQTKEQLTALLVQSVSQWLQDTRNQSLVIKAFADAALRSR